MSRRTFNVLGGISYILGLVGIAFSQEKIANIFELSFLQLNVAKLLAVVFIILGMILFTIGLIKFADEDEETKIEVKDERNIMISGKVSEVAFTINTFLIVSVFLICIVMEYIIPAMMILVVLIANIFVSIYTNKYYQKKF